MRRGLCGLSSFWRSHATCTPTVRELTSLLPDLPKNFLARQNAIAVKHQILQQLQLFRGQRNPAAGAADFGPFKIDETPPDGLPTSGR